MPSVALATCREFPRLDDEDRLLLPALERAGLTGVPAVWTDASVDWASFEAVVIRATWDYHERRPEFLAWTRHVEAQSLLLNAARVVEWNTDKCYLRDLASAGLRVVPTVFLEPDDDPGAWQPPAGFEDFVVKPAISAGSRNTMRYAAGEDLDAARAHARRLLDEGRTVMVQPYLQAVDIVGETALIIIDGEFSHSIRKGPLLVRGVAGEQVEGLFAAEQIDARDATDDERALAAAIVAEIPGGASAVLYARVDLIPGEDGRPVLLELELTEPSLFLSHSPGAADRMARAIARRL